MLSISKNRQNRQLIIISKLTCAVISLPRRPIFDCVRPDTNMITGHDFCQDTEEQERTQLQTDSSSSSLSGLSL